MKLEQDKFWFLFKSEYQELFKMFLKHRVVNISNAGVERSFSQTKFLSDLKRNKISCDLLKKRIMLREIDDISNLKKH